MLSSSAARLYAIASEDLRLRLQGGQSVLSFLQHKRRYCRLFWIVYLPSFRPSLAACLFAFANVFVGVFDRAAHIVVGVVHRELLDFIAPCMPAWPASSRE